MADGAEVSVERVIGASPDELWSCVSDVKRMGELSPENVGNTWIKGATGPAVGARFKGDNRNGKKKWSTTAKVVECEPGRVFAFESVAGPFKVARWTYRFNAVDGGTRVTESWIDQRGLVGKVMGKPVSGVADRAAHNRETMHATLDQLAARFATAD
jgi:ribosome-associated toxin RatA of RatAB toxin-antitoxin module